LAYVSVPCAGSHYGITPVHPHAFLVSTATGAVTRLMPAAPPLGLGGAARSGCCVRARQGDALSVSPTVSADARARTGERFGEQRVLSHVVNLLGRPAQHILEAVFTDIAAFTGGGPANDDRTSFCSKFETARQHFLSDPSILARIVDALDCVPCETVIEIVPAWG